MRHRVVREFGRSSLGTSQARQSATRAELEKWHNHDITFLVVAQDELSGVDWIDPEELVVSAEGISVAPGDRVMVSIGMALEVESGKEVIA